MRYHVNSYNENDNKFFVHDATFQNITIWKEGDQAEGTAICMNAPTLFLAIYRTKFLSCRNNAGGGAVFFSSTDGEVFIDESYGEKCIGVRVPGTSNPDRKEGQFGKFGLGKSNILRSTFYQCAMRGNYDNPNDQPTYTLEFYDGTAKLSHVNFTESTEYQYSGFVVSKPFDEISYLIVDKSYTKGGMFHFKNVDSGSMHHITVLNPTQTEANENDKIGYFHLENSQLTVKYLVVENPEGSNMKLYTGDDASYLSLVNAQIDNKLETDRRVLFEYEEEKITTTTTTETESTTTTTTTEEESTTTTTTTEEESTTTTTTEVESTTTTTQIENIPTNDNPDNQPTDENVDPVIPTDDKHDNQPTGENVDPVIPTDDKPVDQSSTVPDQNIAETPAPTSNGEANKGGKIAGMPRTAFFGMIGAIAAVLIIIIIVIIIVVIKKKDDDIQESFETASFDEDSKALHTLDGDNFFV